MQPQEILRLLMSKSYSASDMKHLHLQFKHLVIAEKQSIPTNDRKVVIKMNLYIIYKLMRFTKPPRENNIQHYF